MPFELTDAERAMIEQGREASRRLAQRIGQGLSITDINKVPAVDDKRVPMMVPRPFTLTLDDGRQVRFPQGLHSVPVEVAIKRGDKQETQAVAEHPYVVAHKAKQWTQEQPAAAPAQAPAAPVTKYVPILGHDELPPAFRIGNDELPSSTFVVRAFEKSGLEPQAWNALSQMERGHKIANEVEAAVAAAPKTGDGENQADDPSTRG